MLGRDETGSWHLRAQDDTGGLGDLDSRQVALMFSILSWYIENVTVEQGGCIRPENRRHGMLTAPPLDTLYLSQLTAVLVAMTLAKHRRTE